MAKVKKAVPRENCKFETKIPLMGVRELKLSKEALLYLKLNLPVSMEPTKVNEMQSYCSDVIQ
ncbi:hypothetical protein [Paenibacillus vini]|uniref:Uncharacterized protein n=1 Tax=Paenibacillus vini TaxID=1476024 RepID=A0ABQ4MAA5_9BACL|nr:hypothetical protein [Paenibacillus vini]GIP52916.1 hypothetical protein J42TS3_19510 [Paenibacillus vini]